MVTAIGVSGFWAFAVEEDKPSNPIRVRFFGADAEMLAPDHVFAAPKRIRLKSHLQLSGVLVNRLRLRHPMSQRTFGRF